MGIFSFGKKKDDDAPPRRGSRSGSSRAARGERPERRTRRAERPESDALLLDPTLPEKQRARRRLVGAIALVVAAVIVLPMVLDAHPKPVTSDIAIDIPNKPAKAAPTRDDDPVDTQAGVAHDAPPGATDDTQTAQAPDVASAGSKATSPAAPAAKPQQQAAAKPAPTVKPPVAQAKPPVEPQSQPDSEQAAAANGASPSSPAGARFAVQLGSFTNEATARGWAAKLKSAGVPAYVERRKQADGSVATLLRAGPFADRAAASAAIAKVRDAGLTQ
ncbi:SPOR domain-containing protein [Burkholderia sp. 22PA0099]|uniref:SPOR domain-containing protein n=1 Tax=Burkholderia sp. 22PA0099 TaxID=3237372 RepID=UPI0039C3F938